MVRPTIFHLSLLYIGHTTARVSEKRMIMPILSGQHYRHLYSR